MIMLKKIESEPLPERVFQYAQIVAQNAPINDIDIKSMLEPAVADKAKTSYYSEIKNAAYELKLISSDENKNIILNIDKSNLKDMNTFKRYCNSVIFQDKSTSLYKVIQCILDSNEKLLALDSLTADSTKNYITSNSGIIPEKRTMEGVRFWISFLGFGYVIENSKLFLPNAYVALKDYFSMANFEKKQEYTIEELVNGISKYASVLLHNANETNVFNLAMSNALRQMHDLKEIELKYILDSKKVWKLFKNESHQFICNITHFVYRGLK